MEGKGIVNFTINGSSYGIQAQDVYRIIDSDSPISHLPSAQDYILGVIGFETDIIPVISVRKFFKEAAAEAGTAGKIIIMQKEDSRLGLFIEGGLGFLDGPEGTQGLRLIQWGDLKR